MTIRDLTYRLAAIVLSLGLVLGVGEVALRLFAPTGGSISTGVRYDHARGPQGPSFRDQPAPGPKAVSAFRILVLGDSFAWGSGVYPEDAYPRRLERRLAALDAEIEFEVVNWAHSGWSTRQAWESLRPVLALLDCDLVLVNFTLNDPEPSGGAAREKMIRPLYRRSPSTGWSEALHRHSALYRLFWERLESRRQRRAFDSYYQGLFSGPHWDDCQAALGELREATRALGVPLALVVFPVFDSQLDGTYAYRRQHGKVVAAARRLEIPVLDLERTFRGVDARRLAVEPFTDPHPNELAHRIAADKIRNYLVDEGLIPASFPNGVRRPAVRRPKGAPGRRFPRPAKAGR